MLTKKGKFIKSYIALIKNKLSRSEDIGGLPEEDFEYEMMDLSKRIIRKHIWGEK